MPGFELFGEAERREVNEVMETGVLMRYGFDGMRNGVWKSKELEAEIEKRLNVKHAQLACSGTAALNLALAALGVGAGDEVIMPAFTFVASFESILTAGATPILADIDDTLTLSPAAVEKLITPKTKVVMPVHMCGSMADLDALQAICKKHNLFLLEDAAQAFGASYKGRFLGTIGDAGCFSFDYVKTITCGEGGAMITNEERYAKFADHFSDHGHDHEGSDRGLENHPFIGYNYRISELSSAVGLAQIRRMDEFIGIQRKNKKFLKNALRTIPGLEFRRIPDEEGDSATFLSFFMPSADQAREVMKLFSADGVDGAFYYFDNNWHYIRKWDHLKKLTGPGAYSETITKGMQDLGNTDFVQSDDLISRNISCLIKLSWTPEQLQERADKMVKAIKSVL
ncbi:MAG: DegT/DnrJ/EryC1/StrS family aminotransferase [Ferruginibacter sp.]